MENANTFELALKTAITMPMVRINRKEFLEKYCNVETLDKVIEYNPAYAGIDVTTIDKIAQGCIDYETRQVSLLSFAAGIPGGIVMLGTVVADMAQYMAHILRILQKLLYLYGWEEILGNAESLDDETTNLLTLFIGVMFGVNGASATITKLSESAARKAGKSLMNKALTKGTVYPIVKKIASILGVRMTKEIFAKGVSKIIPVVGGVASGGLTYVSYKPMAIRLKKYLATLKYCDVNNYV